jgi:murein DD-endopeptidase MepM/ murein hydrolase activator NlpD
VVSPKQSVQSGNPNRVASLIAWGIALSLAGFAFYLAWNRLLKPVGLLPASSAVPQATPTQVVIESDSVPVTVPDLSPSKALAAVSRQPLLLTIIPERGDVAVQPYTVELGDSVFEIARRFKIKPETLLWANYDLLNDNPDMISLGMELKIPPVDGVYYQWQEGDTLEAVAGRFEADIHSILGWSGNQLDLVDPQVEVGSWLMLPGGHREFRQWVIPVIPRGRAGVSRELYGAGACEGSYDGAFGTGGFVWPAGNHSLSGNDYWSGHLGIDIAAGEGAAIYAADSGVVVFAGWANGGYGNMVMIDHGNGYQTVYAHLSSVSAGCGQSVSQGKTIAYSGSTGNSTGAHLHFEVRYLGGFVSPWYVLPAP